MQFLKRWFWPTRRYQRKYKFIDKRQQIRFAVDVALHSLLFPVLLLLLLILPPFANLLLGSEAALVKPVVYEFFRVCFDHWWVVLLALFFVGYYSILFSHQIIGPMRRFENALLQRKEKPTEFVRCNLRKRDYFHDFSHLLDETLNAHLEPNDPPASGVENESDEKA